MAAEKTFKAKSVEALGARRLAQLLIEISAGDVAVENLLQLELAGAKGPAKAALEVQKQMADMRRSGWFVEWDESPAFADELDTLRKAIVEHVAKADAAEALDLMWSFMELADSVYGRCDDSGGTVGNVFQAACADLGEIARAAKTDPAQLADRTVKAITNNGYSQYNDLVGILAPALGQEGLEHLKRRMVDLSIKFATHPATKDTTKIGGPDLGSISADERRERYRLQTVRQALRDIADVQGDVDGFIAQYDEETRKLSKVAAGIAQRLLAVGRTEEALQSLDASSRGDSADRRRSDCEWEDARIDVLDALERADEAQQVRWACFENSLSTPHLQAYLERLVDAEVSEATEKALGHVQQFQDRLAALSFFMRWPALDRASRLVLEHAGPVDGNRYEVLAPAARALASEHPLAATLILRAMIDFTLGKAKSTRYRYAARDLKKCSRLTLDIRDFQTHETHDDYMQRLRRDHGRKRSFWNLID